MVVIFCLQLNLNSSYFAFEVQHQPLKQILLNYQVYSQIQQTIHGKVIHLLV